jgi:hypothetical protein
MKTRFTLLIALACLLPCASLFAQGSSSASYLISANSINSGGNSAASTNYTQTASMGLIVMTSTASTSGTYEEEFVSPAVSPVSLQVSAPMTSVADNSTLLLTAIEQLDDSTFTVESGTAVTWSVVSGPITSISSSGVVTPGNVTQTTPAVVQASFGSYVVDFGISILAGQGVPAMNPLALVALLLLLLASAVRFLPKRPPQH